jgi:hypothetical protein
MKRSAVVMVAALSLVPLTAAADSDVGSGRHLRYVAMARIDGGLAPVTIDLQIGLTEREHVARVKIAERRDDTEFAREEVAIDGDGTISGADEALTFEEETLLDLVALQFENLTGVDAGDHWDRSGDLRVGSHETHFSVSGLRGSEVDLAVSRTMEFPDGSRGAWHGNVSYDAAAVVPRTIAIRGAVVDENAGLFRPLQLTARLVGDSFQPPR